MYPFVLWAAVAGVGPLILHYWRREKETPPNLFPGVFFLIDPATPRPQKAEPRTWLLTILSGLAGGMAFPSEAGATSASGGTTVGGSRAALHIQCDPSDTAGDIGRAIDRVAQASQEIPLPLRTVLVISDRTVGVAGGPAGSNVREHVQTGLAKLAAEDIPLALLKIPPGAPIADAEPDPAKPFVAPRLKIVSIERPASWRTGRPVTLTVQVIFDSGVTNGAKDTPASPGTPTADGPGGGDQAPTASAGGTRRIRKLTWLLGDELHEQTDPMPVQSIDLPCGLRLQSFEWVQRFPQAGWWKIEVTAEIDAERQDRRITFLPVRSPTPVWLVEPDDDAGDSRYLALALDPLRQGAASGSGGGGGTDEIGGEGAEWMVRRKTYADLRQSLPEAGVLVLWGAGRGLTREDWDGIQQAAARGMGVWLVGDGGKLPTARDHSLLFWNSDAAAPNGAGGPLPMTLTQRARLGLVPIRGLPDNPIRNALMATGAAVFGPVSIARYYPVQPAQGSVIPVLAIVAGQDQLHPALLETTLGRGMGLLWTVPPVKDNGTLTESALWPLLTELVLERAAPTLGDWPDQPVGSALIAEAGAGAEPPFRVEQLATGASLPGRVELGADWKNWAEGAHLVAQESRPVRHFFRDGRFHFMGTAANARSVQVLRDSRDRVLGIQAVEIPAGEWDDTPLDAGFFRTQGGGFPAVDASATAGAAAVAPVTGREVTDAAELFRVLQEQEAAARSGSSGRPALASVQGTRGDLTPFLLAVLMGILAAWLYLERREYSIAGA
ncbi:MAG TPA: hypothetical protein VL860_10890 [Planctomycetota bacterium]|nr:hypothetical protein [Planctomycetota bacterium]